MAGQRNANRTAQRDAPASQRHRPGERAHQPLGEVRGRSLVGDPLSYHGGLVTTEAGYPVAGADRHLQAFRRRDQHLVTDGVAEVVVHQLELVQVQ